MIGLGRAVSYYGLVRETAIHKLVHGTHPLHGHGEGKHSMSRARRGLEPYCERDALRAGASFKHD